MGILNTDERIAAESGAFLQWGDVKPAMAA